MAERLLRAGETGERTWLRRANCLGIDPELFFPQRGMSTREAKAVCKNKKINKRKKKERICERIRKNKRRS
jgi:hypothetical protein